MLLDIASWLSIGIMVALAIFTISSNGSVFRDYRSFMVLSGSMEPAINIGSIIVVHRQNHYQPREVITFETEDRIVTHRLVEVKSINNKTVFVTKGDANRSEDDAQIEQGSVIGKVVLIIPVIGRLIAMAQSLSGLVFLIMIPGLGLIVDQVIYFRNAKRQG